MPPDNPALLTWKPEVAEVSASGDLGYTSGPFEVRPDRETSEPSGYGHYVSVWKRQPGGEWRVVLDIGIPHDRPRSAPGEEVLRVLPLSSLPPGAGDRENPRVLQELVDADLGLAAKAGLWGYLVALIDAGTEDVRVYRPERFPVEGRERMSDILDLGIGKTTTEVKGGGAASSEDLGYTYGTFVFTAISGRTASSGYLKIWRKVPSAGWRICLDITLPINPS
jgi:ketosteroid isomerase-like protein